MAIVGVNLPNPRQRGLSTLEKVKMAVDIAGGIAQIPLGIAKLYQEGKQADELASIKREEMANAKNLRDENKTKQINDDVDKLYTQRVNSQTYKTAQEASKAFTQLTELEKNPGGASDVALVKIFQAAVEPGGRVTDQEFQLAASTGGFGADAARIMQYFQGTGKIRDQDRKELIRIGQKLAKAHIVNSLYSDEGFVSEAKQRGVDAHRVIRDYDPNALPELLKSAGALKNELQMIENFNNILSTKKRASAPTPQKRLAPSEDDLKEFLK